MLLPVLDPLVSVSGVRGTTIATSLGPPSLDEDRVYAWAAAFAEQLGRNAQVIIGQDTRPSGEWMVQVAEEAFEKHGVRTVVVGVVPTPTAQLAVTHHRADGGLMITASHNPVEWNGLKFLGADGVFLSAEEMTALHNAVFLREAKRSDGSHAAIRRDSSPAAQNDIDAIQRHIENVLALPIDVEKIRTRKFRVVVDPVNGAGAPAVPPFLERLGCDVTVINGEPNGNFAHPPEPTPANLGELGGRLRTERAHLGIAVDPDADRLVLVDETGTVLSEEYTVTLAIQSVLSSPYSLLRKGPVAPTGLDGHPTPYTPTVVVNLSTTRMVDDIARQFGATTVRTPVGERHVVEGIRQYGALIGGEGNGGVIFPKSHEGRDSLVGIALILDLLARRGASLGDTVATLPRYTMVKEKLPRTAVFDAVRLETALRRSWPNARASTLDGLRIDTAEGWVHLRPSNTEPMTRLIAEATSEQAVHRLLDAARAAARATVH